MFRSAAPFDHLTCQALSQVVKSRLHLEQSRLGEQSRQDWLAPKKTPGPIGRPAQASGDRNALEAMASALNSKPE
jgi:hypothetical protein